jgi:hypothetical protein
MACALTDIGRTTAASASASGTVSLRMGLRLRDVGRVYVP